MLDFGTMLMIIGGFMSALCIMGGLIDSLCKYKALNKKKTQVKKHSKVSIEG